jgi:type I restriction-modification system DNA methylase subunit/predicted type IV restriction endonuclease
MPAKTTVPKIVLDLAERFDRHREAYLSGQYSETQLRQEFINPFFEALGWDVHNKQGYAEAYKDVIHEDAIKVGSFTKAPDYCFRVGGTRKFFLEAKKPSVNIKDDISPAFQLRRYAWSAKLPLSILTDFEEFAVYDCRQKPNKADKASTARILYLTYQDYTPQWEKIVSIFSHEAVLKGSFDRYIESAKGKKGTAEVDAAFLKEIESWREMLARNIALRNAQLSQRELNFSVQRIIDRIIFLRICEDRGIEDYGRLMGLLNGAGVYERLLVFFKYADQRYNSGLFHFQPEKGRHEEPDKLTPTLTLDDKPLKEIIKNLYYPDSPYEFAVLSADILGQVYEQFLGKVIRLTAGHQAKVEDKPEVKKAGGVYYTPTYIVDYIVKNTVGKIVGADRAVAPDNVGADPRVCPQKGEHTGSPLQNPKQVSKIRILDPACGSGSFLIGAYQYLLDWHRDWYVNDDPPKWAKGKTPAFYQAPGGEWRLTIPKRKEILLNNIYGVDIDPQAVEVTKLSLLLKVLEGETQPSFFRERALPDLGSNIKCGNSLIGPDFYKNRQMNLLDEEEHYRINAFDWEAEFPKIMKAGGFDAVIGNPPYGASLSPEETTYLIDNYKLQNYQLDSYVLFIEKSLNLLKENSYFGMIIPNTLLSNLQYNRIRLNLFNHTQIENIVHFLKKVFSGATVDTEIITIKKEMPTEAHQIKITIIDKKDNAINHSILLNRWQTVDGKPVNIFEKNELATIVDKIKGLDILNNLCVITQGAKPFQVGKGNPPQTRKIVDEKPFVSEKKQDSTFLPLLRGSLIQRYQILWNKDYWIGFGDWLAEPRYSANFDAQPKIVIRQTGDSLIATLDRDKFIVRDNLYTIIPQKDGLDLRYILGLLNSKLLCWFYQTVLNPEKGEALAQVKRGHLAQLPIVSINFSDPADKSRHDRMVKLVEHMLALHKQLAAAKTDHEQTAIKRQIETTDRQIDNLVYELYELTEEEIKIVES